MDFEFFKHTVYPHGLKECLIVRIELNSAEKAILCTGDNDEPYTMTIGEMYAGTTSIPYTKVTSIHYQALSKKDTTWKIDVNNLSVR